MKAVVIDLTHGGILISKKLKNLNYEVYAYDIYNTLKEKEKKELENLKIKLIKSLDDISIGEKTLIISPIHCPIELKTFKNTINFHQANTLILEKWNKERKKEGKIIIEITGVKGKTSTVNLIKEILNKNNDLLSLSSLGAYYYKNGKEKLLKKNISINPTSLIELIDLSENKDYKYILAESSLGVSSLNDISILTNIIEDYPIAKGMKKASDGKKQIFNSKLIIGEYENLKKYYPEEFEKLKYKINTFSIKEYSTVHLKKLNQNIDETKLTIEYKDLKTLDGISISGELELNTFAPGEYNILNILSSVTCALSLGISESEIKTLESYKGINGRTSKRTIKKSVILEEINPGLNVTSIEKSIEMIENLNNYSIIIGGEYGITCEEIDEEKLSEIIEQKLKRNLEIILVDKLGESLKNKIKENIKYYKDYNKALDKLIKQEKNVLFIYRSNYSNLDKR